MKTYLEPEEVELLEEAATNLRDRLLIRLLFRLGCRISEALSLTVEDIDFDQSTVTIEHLKARLRLFCPNCSGRLAKTLIGRKNWGFTLPFWKGLSRKQRTNASVIAKHQLVFRRPPVRIYQ